MRGLSGLLRAVAVALLVAMLTSTGCAYLKARGNDALDIFDVGVTVSKKPGLSLYIGFLNIISGGYSNMDGHILGIGGSDTGVVPARHKAHGVVLWGKEQLGYRDVDFSSPNSPEPWHVGVVGLIQGPGPKGRNVVNCPKLFHLGFIGLTLNCKFGEAADFLLGWFGGDIRADDAPPPAS